MNKCFTNVFDVPMKQAGFHRKGVLYYRMNGDILQGIGLRKVHLWDYEVCFNFFPYWVYPFDVARFPTSKLKKGYWVTNSGVKFPVGGLHYEKCPDEKQRMKDLGEMLHRITEQVLPLLDSVKDLDSYLQVVLRSQEESLLFQKDPKLRSTEYKGLRRMRIFEHALLQKAYIEGSFDNAKLYFQRYVESCAESACLHVFVMQDAPIEQRLQAMEKQVSDYKNSLLEEFAYSNARYSFMPTEQEKKERYAKEKEGTANCIFQNFVRCMETNDLNWIKGVYDEASATMKRALREELKLEVL